MKRLLYPGLILLTVLLCAGCVKRELELPDGQTVHIRFDWSRLADAHKKPSSLQIRFYSPEGDFLFVRTCAPDYFEGRLPEGTYKILTFTPDTTHVRYEHMDTFGEAQITVPADPSEEASPEPPSNLYGTSIANLTVSAGQPVDTTVTIRPYLHTVTVYVKITGSPAEVVSCTATVNGLARAVNLSTGFPVLGTPGTVSAGLYPQNETYQGSFLLTGNDDRYPSVIAFKLLFKDGTERIVEHPFEDFMKKIDRNESDLPFTVELTLDVQAIDGVLTATLTDWIYKQGEIVLD